MIQQMAAFVARTLVAACLSVAALLLTALEFAAGAPPDTKDAPPDDASRPNLISPTLGGMQFWSDELVLPGWRIQRHAWTHHYRLLDDKDNRQAWGDFPQCRARLESLRAADQAPPLKRHVVLVLHGLGRTRQAMDGLCAYLRTRGDFTVLNVSYASTRESLDEHADSLAKVIANLEGTPEISFVGHSLGNLVIRRYLDGLGERQRPNVRIRRIVMLGPPNNGSQLAQRLGGNRLFETIFGNSGRSLAENWEAVAARLATPTCEFGIIAGGTNDAGRNPLLEGDDDLVVSVAETRLPGAHDFIVVPVVHTRIMDDPAVQEYTLRFLQRGCFLAEEKRCPIPAGPETAAKR